MKQLDMLNIVDNIDEERRKTFVSRNEEYSQQDEDNGLSNFHDVAAIAKVLGINISASDFATLQLILKMVRDANAKRLKIHPEDPKRKDHLQDHHNYLDLSHMCELEEVYLPKKLGIRPNAVITDEI